ncbi:MAG: leucine-rich repeat protein, partial [Bacteroidetes bacterium]|nr:leucine-rich repeat protein [Bacteroidota bacterium]
MKITFYYIIIFSSLSFLQAQESTAVYLSFSSSYDSEFADANKSVEQQLFLSLRSWMSTYVDFIENGEVSESEFLKCFQSGAKIDKELLPSIRENKPEDFAKAVNEGYKAGEAYFVNNIKVVAIKNKKEGKFDAIVNFDQGEKQGKVEIYPAHGYIEMNSKGEGFDLAWKELNHGYYTKKEKVEAEHLVFGSTGTTGLSPGVQSSNYEFGTPSSFKIGYYWKNPISASKLSFLMGAALSWTSSALQISEGSSIRDQGTPNSLQLTFLSAPVETENRISGEFHTGIDWSFGSRNTAGWGLSALLTIRVGEYRFSSFSGRVEYSELWDELVLVRDVINCGLSAFGEEGQDVRTSSGEFSFRPGFLLRPRWISKNASWGRIQLGIDAQIFPALGDEREPTQFLRPERGVIDPGNTQIRYEGESLHDILSEVRTDWYAGVNLSYVFPNSSKQKFRNSQYDDLFSKANRSGYEGKAYLILNGDITDAEAAERIRQDLGPATQFVWVINTSQLENVEIPTMRELLNIKVSNNKSLKNISFPELNQVINEIEVTQNPNLEELDFGNIEKIFTARIQDNRDLPKVELVSLISVEDQLSILDNSSLSSFNAPRLTESKGGLYFSNNRILTEILLPNLEVTLRDITMDENSALKKVHWPNLKRVDGNIFISGNQRLSQIGLPSLTKISKNFNLQGNDSLEEVEFQALENVGQELLLSSNSRLKKFKFERLIQVGGDFSFSFNKNLEDILVESLRSIGGDLVLNAQDSLLTLSLPDLNRVEGSILLLNNKHMKNLRFSELQQIGGVFQLQGAMTDSLRLPNLSKAGGLQLGSNLELSNLHFPKLTTLRFEANEF